ncbi:transposase [Streptomyces samsunensis]|uniref:Transposase n=1 Tax=Streptomyces malaysiensis subsp. samsunensis TaxID=459658 RepID=A0A9X2M4B3_STRMQ|nr:transposase [Streptomyces samsunensis]MCQ8836225.1 transposase [Streptomyces samsunensis]
MAVTTPGCWRGEGLHQAAGLGGKVVAGTPRDSLYVLDVLYGRDGGKRPEMIVTDTASYSDIVFGLPTLAGFAYAPQLADLPDQRMWRVDRTADYGARSPRCRTRAWRRRSRSAGVTV